MIMNDMNPLEIRMMAQVLAYLFKVAFDNDCEDLDTATVNGLKQGIRTLRRAYRPVLGRAVEDCYGSDVLRGAYMAAYYVHYIMPVKRVLSAFFAEHHEFLQRELRIRFLAGGPCPELVGTLMALWESRGFLPAEVSVLDAEAGWRPYLEGTLRLCRRLYKDVPPVRLFAGCDLRQQCGRCSICRECQTNTFGAADLIIMQNYLSHIAEKETGSFLEAMEARVRCIPRGAAVIVMDLDYGQAKRVIREMGRFPMLRIWETNVEDYSPGVISLGTPGSWRERIFTGEDGLIPKGKTRYYYGVYEVA